MSPIEHPARFVLRTYDGEILREHVLDKPQITIGRASNRDISLPQDKLISRRHLVINYQHGRYILFDEGSANGTYINGRLIEAMQSYELSHDDLITLGRHQLIFQQSADVAIEDLPTVDMPLDDVLKAELEEQRKRYEERPVPQSLVGVSLPPPDVSAITKFQSTAPMRVISANQLRFTAFYPNSFSAGEWGVLLVYAHMTQASNAIQQDALSFKEGLSDISRKPLSTDSQVLLQSTGITVIPECPGISFNPRRLTFRWSEEWHRAELRFSIKKDCPDAVNNGMVSIFAGPLLLAMLPLQISCESSRPVASSMDVQVSAPAFKQIFASYSRDDTAVMAACRNTFRALGFAEMARVDALRASQIADSALQHLISESEVFQLFWSHQAAQAAYVTREWEYALQLQRGAKFLRPVYWDVSPEMPPESLRPFHFTYLPSYTFSSQR